ncbi:MAG: ATP-binding protein [Clostridiaceae bacterium]|nr:ATP-binding protein [Clostridiaceae bacterium]
MEIWIHTQGEPIHTQAEPGDRLLDVLRRFPISFSAPCGGHGNCGGCRVLIDGVGDRLACRTTVADVMAEIPDTRLIEIRIPEPDAAQILTDAAGLEIALKPLVTREDVALPLPTLQDQRPDAERFLAETGHCVPIELLRKLPFLIRNSGGELSYIVRRDNDEVIDLVERNATGPYGVAVDIGTTTLAAYLFHLGTGRPLGHRAMPNPQSVFGADVISRIGSATASRRNQTTMKERIGLAIQELASALAADAVRGGEDVQLDEIHLYVLAGNTTMLHLLVDVAPDSIAKAPFIPVFTDTYILSADRFGLAVRPGALCVLLPSVSAYVGADIVSGILACGMEVENGKNRLLIDIGTNGEIALAAGGHLYACSTAAGPAFEGANIRQGMSAVVGAIDHVGVKDGDLTYTWIGEGGTVAQAPRGLCGSAILDTVRVLIEQRLLLFSGRMVTGMPGKLGERVIEVDGQPAFVVVAGHGDPPTGAVLLRQEDIREIQNAKAAIAAGIATLLSVAGLQSGDVDEIYLAGGFGNYLDPDSAIAIGLLPREFAGRIRAAGNTSGVGASMCLLSTQALERAETIARQTEYIELSGDPGFSDRYIDEMVFPDLDDGDE